MTKWRDQPWFTASAVRFLDNIITKNTDILEIGSGSSTVWFAKRAKYIKSFEHSKNWADLVRLKLKEAGFNNCELIFDSEYPERGIRGVSEKYDLIIIDGRGRVKSIKTTCQLLKSGGYLMLDDAQRVHYRDAKIFLDGLGWEKTELKGPFKRGWLDKKATAWRKP